MSVIGSMVTGLNKVKGGIEMEMMIGNKLFGSKAEAKAHFKDMLARYEPGDMVNVPDAIELYFLLRTHQWSADKIGVDVAGFSVARCPEYSTKHFVVMRTDGSETDFSYLACIAHTGHKTDAMNAMRREVRGQIDAFRREALASGQVECPYTGVELTYTNSHVDHAAPNTFESLAKGWLEEEGLNLTGVMVSAPRDAQTCAEMTDEYQAESWRTYHEANATLRLLSKEGNLSQARGK